MKRRKHNILVVFTSQSYFAVPITIRLNSTDYFAIKITNKTELQQMASKHLSDTEF